MGENNWPFLGTEADFHPQIGVFRLSDGTATPGKTITFSGRDGKPLVGLVDPQANTGETVVGIDGKPLPTSDHGLDTEGLVALPDGTFWVSDEYGPFLVHFDAEGKETERLSPLDGTLSRELSLPIETVVGVTTDAADIDKLKSLGFTVAAKSLKLDLGALLVELNDKGEFFGHDKIEGLATPDDGKTLVVANDSDSGLAGIASDTPSLALESKTLANGRQDSGEFLVVDTTKLPVHTETKMVSIKVG